MQDINAILSQTGFALNGILFDSKVMLSKYTEVLGEPSFTIEPGPPAPYGHRNNQVHVYEYEGIYLTEHHYTCLIESVNFVFAPEECSFQVAHPFSGKLEILGVQFHVDMALEELGKKNTVLDFQCLLGGQYRLYMAPYWVGISAKGKRGANRKRGRTRHIECVSICWT